MPSSLLDVCRFTPTAGGTTDFTFSAAVTGYQSPTAAGVQNASVYSYRAESADLTQWEVGTGAYTTATGILARTTVLFNSLGTTAKINFSAVPQVALVALAEDFMAIVNVGPIINSIGADVLSWFASGSVNLFDPTTAGMLVKLWDGTSVISSASLTAIGNNNILVSLSGFITSPAGNIRISVKDLSNTTGKILFNSSGNSKDSTLTVFRIK